MRRIGHAIDLVRPAGQPITAVHLGGGALTLPRYVEHTRPGSRQQVVDYDSELVDFVRAHLPLPSGASIRIRHGDAREVVSHLPAGLRGSVDLVVIDVFVGSTTPGHVTSRQFYELLVPLMAPGGLVAVNMADGSPPHFARAQVATMRTAFRDVALLVDSRVIKTNGFGNYIGIASPDELAVDGLPRLLASDPAPGRLMTGAELDRLVSTAAAIDDTTATDYSPLIARSVFQVRPQRLNEPDEDAT